MCKIVQTLQYSNIDEFMLIFVFSPYRHKFFVNVDCFIFVVVVVVFVILLYLPFFLVWFNVISVQNVNMLNIKSYIIQNIKTK